MPHASIESVHYASVGVVLSRAMRAAILQEQSQLRLVRSTPYSRLTLRSNDYPLPR